ncbi:MAG: hypothetical protein ACRECX_08645 [Methyloceanibacter sp.]|uniref:hypothetical protein n=1 Tax=Methyloceanibacter sp. TaxID=1965321 RepID=UPI003D6D6ECE
MALFSCGGALAAPACPAERGEPLVPADRALCASLEEAVRKPGALPQNEYEDKLAEFLRNFCHRNEAAGWKSDKYVRDTGPFIGTFDNGKWTGQYHGTHAPSVIWYSPDMVEWLKRNRPEDHAVSASPEPVPDGAVMVKEMYPPPRSHCKDVEVEHLFPLNGSAIMVRAGEVSQDGWFWGWFGWKDGDWTPTWPASSANAYPNMGFGLYCTNCHSSAKDNHTFAALRNIKGEPGEPLVYLNHDFYLTDQFQTDALAALRRKGLPLPPVEPFRTFHEEVGAEDDAAEISKSMLRARRSQQRPYDEEFAEIFQLLSGAPAAGAVSSLPSETYDHVWIPAGKPSAKSRFMTSDQCIGCHDAGGTGLQFHMTEPGPDQKLTNISPYGTWRSSPMGLSGRDPVFFAQLASEIETFHPESSALLQDTCLSCHAVQGHRQHAIDRHAETGECEKMARAALDAVPYPPDDPAADLAHYAALGRDGVSCTTCHSMVLGKQASDELKDAPQNACVAERQARINPGLTGLAQTFTGNFLVASPGELFGPYEDPKKKSMEHATGLTAAHSEHVKSSEICASCHTVHLPVLHRGKIIGHTYEQATYPEWAFSSYRTGETVDGELPLGPGAKAQSCQGCHMPTANARGKPYRTKIATIQEYSGFPQAEHTLPPEDIDLEERDDFAKHTLVGLNLFLTKMAQQFPDVLGIRDEDPMLPSRRGIDPLVTTEAAMLEQAGRTAEISVSDVTRDGGTLAAKVTIANKAGHKFPSGVAFRRAFVEFTVRDKDGSVLWASGRTNGAGVIVDETGVPLAGELWWTPDCGARIDPQARAHQPHYQIITSQDQAQIYQELAAAPADVETPSCGAHAKPDGPLTTSFLSICAKVKDNRLLPSGFLPLEGRMQIAAAFGAKADLAEDVAPVSIGDDPDYAGLGADTILYRIPLADIAGEPAEVEATLYYQATPPFFLQDRFCTAKSEDTRRLYDLAGKLDTRSGPIADWKLKVGQTATASVP